MKAPTSSHFAKVRESYKAQLIEYENDYVEAQTTGKRIPTNRNYEIPNKKATQQKLSAMLFEKACLVL